LRVKQTLPLAAGLNIFEIATDLPFDKLRIGQFGKRLCQARPLAGWKISIKAPHIPNLIKNKWKILDFKAFIVLK
jgi:hypothetical protein